MDRVNVGDIVVCEGEPPEGNPYLYRGAYSTGGLRSAALGRFLRGIPDPELTFWFAPVCGGARRLEEPPDVGPALDYYWTEEGHCKHAVPRG